MIKSKNTKGLKGSVDCIDSDELKTLKADKKSLERQLAEARESSIKVSKYLKGVCEKRICVDGIYFGFVDGSWEKASDQLIAKQRYELGLEQLKEKG